MTELARLHDRGVHRYEAAGDDGVPAGVRAIEIWARTAKAAADLVDSMLDSPFVPDSFRPRLDPRASEQEREMARRITLATATAAVLYGGEIGLSPMQSLNNVIVIKGRPGLYAETMVALVQAAGHEIWTEEVTDTRAVVCGRRRGSAFVERAVFTMERARKAGYLKNAKYTEDPQSMLYARAASIACRRTAPEVLKGVAAIEELRDGDQTAYSEMETAPDAPAVSGGHPASPPTRTAQRKARPQPVAAIPAEPPPLPGEAGYDEPSRRTGETAVEPPTEALRTDAQSARIFATLKDQGITDKDESRDIIRRMVGRDLASSKELTRAEAGALIDRLEEAKSREDGFSGFLAELLVATEVDQSPAGGDSP